MSEDEEPSKSPVRAGRNDGVTLSLSQSRSARGAGAPEGTHASVSNNDDGRQCFPPIRPYPSGSLPVVRPRHGEVSESDEGPRG